MTTTYTITPAGHLMKVQRKGQCRIMQSSKSMSFVIEDAKTELEKEAKLMKQIAFWELPTGVLGSGSFNVDLYNRVLEAKGVKHA